MSDNKYLIVIPARGGSKRLPQKNILPLNGIPLITWSINYGEKELPNCRIVVSSDSDEILEIAHRYRAIPCKRPDEFAGDHVTTASVLNYIAEDYLSSGLGFEYMILLQPTNPLRPIGMLRNAISIIEKGPYDSLMTVSKTTRKLGKIINGQYVPWNYTFGMRSQDMDPLYYENGLLYITAREQILKGNIMGEKMFPLIVDHVYGTVDIDTAEDFLYAEYVLNNFSKYE